VKILIVFDIIHPLLDSILNYLQKFNHCVELLHWSEFVFFLNFQDKFNEVGAIYLDRMGENFSSYSTQLSLISYNKKLEGCIINNPKKYWCARNKALSHFVLNEENILTPKTFVVLNESQATSLLTPGTSWILKSYLGVCAEEVIPFSWDKFPHSIFSEFIQRDGLVILQEFIFCPQRYIWRIDIVNGNIIVANKRFSFNSSLFPICNGTQGGHVEFLSPDSLTPSLSKFALQGAASMGLEIAGVDIIENEFGKHFCLEVNPEPDITLDRFEFPIAIADLLIQRARIKVKE